MKVHELRKCGVQFLMWYLLVTVLSLGVAFIWPNFGGVPGTALTMVAAMQTLRGFLKQNDALPNRVEFWQLVGVGTATAVMVEAIKLGVFVYTTPYEIPEVNLILLLMVGIAATLLPAMLGFSRVFGGGFLQGIRKKRQKAAARTAAKG